MALGKEAAVIPVYIAKKEYMRGADISRMIYVLSVR